MHKITHADFILTEKKKIYNKGKQSFVLQTNLKKHKSTLGGKAKTSSFMHNALTITTMIKIKTLC